MNRTALTTGLIILGIAAVVAYLTLFTVDQTQQAIVLEFGKPKREIKDPGLHYKVPFIQNVEYFDKRILDIDTASQEVIASDQKRLVVDAFARYRITDPLQMYIAAGSEERVSDALRPILGSALRNELGKRQFAAMLSPERGTVMQNIRVSLNRVARQYGAEIIDVRIKRADLPDGTPQQSAFQRMRTAREQQALTIRAQGAKQAQLIRADADAAAAKVYAASFGKDPKFYDFYRAMQAYNTTFGQNARGQTSVILSPDNDFLREFRGR